MVGAGACVPSKADPGKLAPSVWSVAPDTTAHYPPTAATLGLSGRVALSCEVSVDGRLSACLSLVAKPDGLGFGQAALVASETARLHVAAGSPPTERRTATFEFTPPVRPTTWVDRPASGAMALERAKRFVALTDIAQNLEQAAVRRLVGAASSDGDFATREVQIAAQLALRTAAAAERSGLDARLANLFAAIYSPDELTEFVRYAESDAATLVIGMHPAFPDFTRASQNEYRRRVSMELRLALCGSAECMPAGQTYTLKGPHPAVASPAFAATPSERELISGIPGAGEIIGVAASAELVCEVSAGGGLDDCEVAMEAPAGFGFGRAALSLAPKYRLAAAGGLVGTRIAIPVRFPAPRQHAPMEPIEPRSVASLRLARAMMEARQEDLGDVSLAPAMARFQGRDLAALSPEHRLQLESAVRKAIRAAANARDDQNAAFYTKIATDEQLRLAAEYYRSSAWHALNRERERYRVGQRELSEDFQARVSTTARRIFCAVHRCIGVGAQQAAIADPSTRNP